ncbi:hypothetical protein DFA_02840 [Cavenderia fasciculata]|uniref:Uncharacterized protein n=1 Tax=Cavenderia fasciculata TaxID=261658 RepID=F4PIL7_CACFS|nr:uncharacterized protein DFA_02840 [Cavenderia fasciculata]EGG24597.1 hypothetical protein DFA_02840 [Cavenderia fasciculata]|eukprot:XP_004362448.1 hypothetical protein DFA_02840 [Cavenderia fasciculata]
MRIVNYIVILMMTLLYYSTSIQLFVNAVADPCAVKKTVVFESFMNKGCMNRPTTLTAPGANFIDINLSGWNNEPVQVGKALARNNFLFSVWTNGTYRASWSYYGTDGTTVCQGTNDYRVEVQRSVLKVEHPQCPYGATVYSVTEPSLWVSVVNAQNVNVLLQNNMTTYASNLTLVGVDLVDQCNLNLVAKPKLNSLPQYVVTPEAVGSPGKLRLTNLQDYQTASLYDASNPSITFPFESETSTFTGIKLALMGQVILEVNSATCGVQRVPITIGWIQPKVSLDIYAYSCGSEHAVAFLTVDGIESPKIIYHGDLVPASPFPININPTYDISWYDPASSIGETNIPYEIPVWRYNVPYYTVIENPAATPNALTKIKFQYNGNFSNLRFDFAEIGSTGIVFENEIQTITLPFVSGPADLIVTSICEPFTIVYPYTSVTPSYHVVSKTCLDPMDLRITNAQYFQTISIETVDSGTPYTLHSVGGVFSNIPQSRGWILTATYVNSSETYSYSTIELYPQIDIRNNITVALENITGQDCGNLDADAVFTYDNKVVATKNINFDWSTQILISPNDNCYFQVTAPIPLPKVIANIEEPAVCKESYAKITFNYTTSPMPYVSINTTDVRVDVFYVQLLPGTYIINAGLNQDCSVPLTVVIKPTSSFSLFEKNVLVTPQDSNNCITPSGSIKLINATDTEQFSRYDIIGMPGTDNNGVWTLNSRVTPEILEFDHFYCGAGKMPIQVPTTPDNNIQYTIKDAHCSSAQSYLGDGKVIFSTPNNLYNFINNFDGYFHIPSKTWTDLTNGTHTIGITKSNACAWVFKLNIGNNDEYKLVPNPMRYEKIYGSSRSLLNITTPPLGSVYVNDLNDQQFFGSSMWPSEPANMFYLREWKGRIAPGISYGPNCNAYGELVYDLTPPNTPEPSFTMLPSCNGSSTVVLAAGVANSYNVYTPGGFLVTPTTSVRDGEQLNFYTKGSEYTGQYLMGYAPVTNQAFNVRVVNASCEGANDGQIIVTTNATGYTFALRSGEGDFIYPFDNETGTFSNLPSYDYNVIFISSFCLFEETFNVYNADETNTAPLKVLGAAICNTKDSKATISFSETYPGNSIAYTLNGVVYNESSIQLPVGSYSGLLNASTDSCLSANQAFQFQVTNNPIVATLTPDNCSVSVSITGGNSQTYTISLFDSTQQIYERVDGISTYKFDEVSLGQYTIVVTDDQGCQSDTFNIQVEECGRMRLFAPLFSATLLGVVSGYYIFQPGLAEISNEMNRKRREELELQKQQEEQQHNNNNNTNTTQKE